MNLLNEKANSVAREILVLSRNTLLVNLRFLDMALSRLELKPIQSSTILTNGSYILYNPLYVLETYKNAKEIPVRNYLHMVMHCVFRHMYVEPSIDRAFWDVACDIAVENVIIDLGLKATASMREAQQEAYISSIRDEITHITAEKIYAYFKQAELAPHQIEEIKGLFGADDHEIWYMTDEDSQTSYGINSNDNTGNNSESKDSNAPTPQSRFEQMQDWKNISERMETDVLMFSNGRYGDAGSIVQNLKAVNREKYDYAAFLKKFAVMGEAMKINDDEFDYIFYTYGLKQYKNMPLIEPLEYKEIKAIKEFVIAIDTSGSVIGDLVQTFVQKTYNILKTTESFFSKINLHIIQCDTEIQEHVKITSQEEFDQYIDTMTLKGFGGNNEIALFSYVDELVRQREFSNLKGMIYLTDGYGIFPDKKPNYEVAFVFINDRYEIPEVPPWVIRLVLQKDEI